MSRTPSSRRASGLTHLPVPPAESIGDRRKRAIAQLDAVSKSSPALEDQEDSPSAKFVEKQHTKQAVELPDPEELLDLLSCWAQENELTPAEVLQILRGDSDQYEITLASKSVPRTQINIWPDPSLSDKFEQISGGRQTTDWMVHILEAELTKPTLAFEPSKPQRSKIPRSQRPVYGLLVRQSLADKLDQIAKSKPGLTRTSLAMQILANSVEPD